MASNRFDAGFGARGAHYAAYCKYYPAPKRGSMADRENHPLSESAGICRLGEYFTANTNIGDLLWSKRKIGLEIESLFIDRTTGLPITKEVSQRMYLRLVGEQGWKMEEIKGDMVTKISCGGTDLIVDLGWNNFELITPTWSSDEFKTKGIDSIQTRLEDVYKAAEHYNACPSGTSYDGHADKNTLAVPDERDDIWTKLDGPVLCVLGHIASVHVNIDLKSVDEGFEFIRRLNQYYDKVNWPPRPVRDAWDKYIAESAAGYEVGRYGPPPESFPQYLKQLAKYKVFMNKNGKSGLKQVKNPKVFHDTLPIDYELFLRSVWWWSRLRVRRNNLVLEVRAIPRGNDADLRQDVENVLSLLDL